MNYLMQLVNSQHDYKRYVLPATIFFVTATIIWCITPLISIHGHMPFAHASRRGYFILAILSCLLGKIFFLDGKKQQVQLKSINPDFDRKMHTLEGQLQGVVNFFKKTVIKSHNKKIRLNQLPWYLVLGPKDAGKTTLLANANIQYVLKKQINLTDVQTISSSQSCGWWATQDSVLVDVPGYYLTANTVTNPLWSHFLNLLTVLSPPNIVNGVIVTLPLPDLIDRERRKALERNLAAAITELHEAFDEQLPFYFIITKSDLLPGFADFFGDCGSDELGQAWGITLPSVDHDSQAHQFSQRFNALIKRLNKQLIWRLHQERDFNQRVHIKNFPLQVEHLKEILLTLISALTNHHHLNLKGTYLTSATQLPVDNLTPQHMPLNAGEEQQALQILSKPQMPTRSYFIRQFLSQGLAKTYASVPETLWYKKPFVYMSCALAIVFMLAFISYDMQSREPIYTTHALKVQQAHSNIVSPESRKKVSV